MVRKVNSIVLSVVIAGLLFFGGAVPNISFGVRQHHDDGETHSVLRTIMKSNAEGFRKRRAETVAAVVEQVYPAEPSRQQNRSTARTLGFGYAGRVLLLVSSSLYNSVSASLAVYGADLEQEGYTVEIYSWSGGNNHDLRAFFQQHSDGLVGAVLIGQLPEPWLEWDLEYDDFWCSAEDLFFATCDLPYMDLDGIWFDKDGDGAWDSSDPYSDLEPEIWIGRLYAANLSWVSEAEAINDYLARNHQFRIGAVSRPPRALIFATNSGQECFSAAEFIATLQQVGYDEVACESDTLGLTNSKSAYLDSLGSGNYELLNIRTHGGADRHWFRRSNEYVYGVDIQAAVSQLLFVHNFSCGGCAWTVDDCVASSYIFGQTSGLAVWGTTVIGGFVGASDFYVSLEQGGCFGDGIKAAYDSSLARDYYPHLVLHRSCHQVCYDSLAQVFLDTCFYTIPPPLLTFLGDPTLRPRKRIWFLKADGSGDAPTIQAAIDSARPYDRIALEAGTYSGPGNHDLDFAGKAVILTAADESTDVVIDCGGTGRAFHFHSGESRLTKVVGLTIVNSQVAGDGGAILSEQGSSPEIVDCLIYNAVAEGRGGAVAILDSSNVLVHGCTFIFCQADSGAGIYIDDSSPGTIENSVVAFNYGSGLHYAGDNSAAVSCSDVYGNTGGGFVGFPEMATQNGNFSADPQFCDTASVDFSLLYTTPCRPESSDCGDWVGSTRIRCFTVCGDCDVSGFISVTDAVFLITYIFAGGPAPQPLAVADVDCTGTVNVSDVVIMVDYIFGGDVELCAGCAP